MGLQEYLLPPVIGNVLLLFIIAILLFLYLGLVQLTEDISCLIEFVVLLIAFALNLIEIHYIKVHYTRSYLSYVVMAILLAFVIHLQLTNTF
jgi:uncharacterized membrane protein YesL